MPVDKDRESVYIALGKFFERYGLSAEAMRTIAEAAIDRLEIHQRTLLTKEAVYIAVGDFFEKNGMTALQMKAMIGAQGSELANTPREQLVKSLWNDPHSPMAVRISNRLRREGIYTIEQLSSLSECDLLLIEGIGIKSITKIKDALSVRGLSLRL